MRVDNKRKKSPNKDWRQNRIKQFSMAELRKVKLWDVVISDETDKNIINIKRKV